MKWRIPRPWPWRRRAAETTAAPAIQPPRRARWKRWLLRIAVAVVVLILLVRIALPWIVPFALQKVAAGYGLEARIERLELALLQGEVGFSGLVLRDPELGLDVAQAGFVRARISWLDLLTGNIRLYRVDIDDLGLKLARDEAGRWTWLEKIINPPTDGKAPEPITEEPAVVEQPSAEDGPLIQLADALALPLQIDALRLHRAKLQWRDALGGAPLEAVIALTVRAEHVGYQDDQPTRLEVDLSAAPGLRLLQVRAQMSVAPTGVHGNIAVDGKGIAADTYQRYLTPLLIDAPHDTGEFHVRASVLLRDAAPQYLNGLIEVQDLRYVEGGTVVAHLDYVAVRTDTVAEDEIFIDQIEVRGFAAGVRTYPDGSLSFGGWHLHPAPASSAEIGTTGGDEVASNSSQPQPSQRTKTTAIEDSPSLALWPESLPRLRIRELRIEDGSMHLSDAEQKLPLTGTLQKIELHNFDTRPDFEQAPTRLRLHAAVPPYIGGIQLDGTLAPFDELAHAELTLQCYGLQPEALDQLLQTLGQDQIGVEAARLDAQFSATLQRGHKDGDRIEARVQKVHVLDAASQALLRLELARGAILLPRDPGAIVAETIEISGFDSRAVRTADGTLHCAGLRLAAPTQSATSLTKAEATDDRSVAQERPAPSRDATAIAKVNAGTDIEGVTPSFVLRQLDIKRIGFAFVDQMGELPEPIVLQDFGLELRNAYYPRPPAGSELAVLRMHASLPGLVESFALQSHFDSSADHPRFECSLDATGITAQRAAAVLNRMGIDTELADGRLVAKAAGELLITSSSLQAPLLRIETLTMTDQRRELFTLKEARVENLRYELAADGNPSLDIEAIRWEACQTAVALRGEQGIAALGFVLRKPTPTPASATPVTALDASGVVGEEEAEAPSELATTDPKAAQPTAPEALLQAFHFHLGTLDLPAITIAMTDPHGQEWPVALHSTGHALRFAPSGASHAPGKLLIGASVEGTLEAFEVEADLTATPTRAGLHAAVKARGLDLAPLARYLRDMGFEGEMRDGRAEMQLDADLEQSNGALLASLRLSELSLKDGEREWFGVDRIAGAGLRYEPQRADMGSWIIERPRAEIELRADGSMALLGVAMAGTPAETRLSAAPAPSDPTIASPAEPTPALDSPELEVPAVETAAIEGIEAPLRDVSQRLAVALKSFALRDGRIEVIDQRGTESRSLPVLFHAELGALDTATPTTEAALRIEVLPQPGDGALRIQGDIALGYDQAAFHLALEGRALDLNRYSGFLPPSMTTAGTNGELDGSIEGKFYCDPTSSDVTASLTAHALKWTEAAAPHPWLAWKNLSVALHRAQADATLTIEHLRCEGLNATVDHDHGNYRALGFAFAAPVATAAENQTSEALEPASAAPSITTPPPVPARRKRPNERAVFPRVLLKDLRIELEALRWTDHVDETTKAGGLAALTLTNTQPIDCLGLNYSDRDAIHMRAEGHVEPGIQSFSANWDSNPFATRPHLTLRFKSDGIDAPALRASAPVLLAALNAENLQGGSFAAEMEVELLFARRGPLDFDIAQNFGLFLNLRNVALKDQSGDVLMGMEELFVSAPRIELNRGYAFIRRFDITRPQLQVTRTARGWEALGLVVETKAETASAANTVAPAAPDAPASSDAAAAPTSNAAVQVAHAEETATPPFVVSLQEFQIFDGEFAFADRRVDPPLLVPLESIDFGVRNLTSAPDANSVPIEVDINILAGKVPLPKRAEAGPVPGFGFVTGVLGGLANRVTGTASAVEMESRPLFQELRAEGLFTPTWPPQGHLDFELAGFELSALTSSAKQAAVDIADGVLDANIDLKVDTQGVAHGRNRFYFSHLDIDEPADGPIQRYLKLPAPLNVVVFAVMDDTGAVRIPVNFDQNLDAQMGRGQIMSIAINSLSRTLTHALERGAFRVVGLVTNFGDSMIGGLPLIGNVWDFFFSNAVPPEILEPIEIPFAPGDGFFATDNLARAEEMVARMRSYPKLDVIVEHYPGKADLVRAEILGSPSNDDLEALLTRLDHEMAVATRTRDVLLSQVEAAILADRSSDAAASRAELELRVDRIGELLESKNQVLRWMDERRTSESERRTRFMQLEFARLRMKSTERALLEASKGDDFSKRIRLPRPRPNVPDFEGGGKIVLKPALRRR